MRIRAGEYDAAMTNPREPKLPHQSPVRLAHAGLLEGQNLGENYGRGFWIRGRVGPELLADTSDVDNARPISRLRTVRKL